MNEHSDHKNDLQFHLSEGNLSNSRWGLTQSTLIERDFFSPTWLKSDLMIAW